MTTIDLSGSWTMRLHHQHGEVPRGATRPLRVQVPGTTHGQLLAAGRIPDPHVGREEFAVQWVGRQDWSFSRTLTLSAKQVASARQDLIFAGIDTIATVQVNDVTVATSVNMFREVVADVRDVLRAGRNTITVICASPMAYSEARLNESPMFLPGVPDVAYRWPTGERQVSGRQYIRKVQCHYGWDWGQYITPSGIYRPVWLECSVGPRLTYVTHTQVHHGKAHAPRQVELTVSATLDCPAATRGVLEVTCGGETISVPARLRAGRRSVSATVTINRPRLWWPHGEGEQHLYELTTRWCGEDATVIAESKQRIGLRTIALETNDDTAADGSPAQSFGFRVNGRLIYAKGHNWIPADQFQERSTPAVLGELLAAMTETNCNMVRVWGGGWYETDAFYDHCDALGLLVWQDVMMACAVYPGFDKTFVKEVCAEVDHQARRLQHRACLALWCGDNENFTAIRKWFGSLPDNPKWVAVYKKLMNATRRACTEADPSRRFWLSSPSNDSYDEDPQSQARGDIHYWRPWQQDIGIRPYRDQHPRFASEFGFQSFPEYATLADVVPAPERNPASRTMEHHQRSPPGNKRIVGTMMNMLQVPSSFADFCWASQFVQAEAMRTAIEHWRRIKPWCMGTLIWQLNDLWPAASWSAIDYAGRWKALHHYTARLFAPLLTSFVDSGPDEIAIHLTSDRPQRLTLSGKLQIYRLDGRLVNSLPLQARLAAQASKQVWRGRISDLLEGGVEPHEICVFVSWEDASDASIAAEAWYNPVPWKWTTLTRPDLKPKIRHADGRIVVSIRPRQVVAGCHLRLHGHEGHFTHSWSFLHPGRTYRFSWVPHTARGGKIPTVSQVERNLRIWTLADTMTSA